MAKFRDLTGQRFGALTALRRSDNPDRHIRWVCRCDCGNMVEVQQERLRNGEKKDCGCALGKPVVGMRYGSLTVLGKDGSRRKRGSRGLPLWKFRCDCGKVVYDFLDVVQCGNRQSCGCMHNVESHMQKAREASGLVGHTQTSKLKSIMEANAEPDREKLIGVNFEAGRWRARIKFQGKTRSLGSYGSYQEAAQARLKAEKELFGVFLESTEAASGDENEGD